MDVTDYRLCSAGYILVYHSRMSPSVRNFRSVGKSHFLTHKPTIISHIITSTKWKHFSREEGYYHFEDDYTHIAAMGMSPISLGMTERQVSHEIISGHPHTTRLIFLTNILLVVLNIIFEPHNTNIYCLLSLYESVWNRNLRRENRNLEKRKWKSGGGKIEIWRQIFSNSSAAFSSLLSHIRLALRSNSPLDVLFKQW